MLKVSVIVAKSDIHGDGVFASSRVSKGQIVWRFDPDRDKRVNRMMATFEENHFSYCNAATPDELVVCDDEAIWMNFDKDANTELGNDSIDGELDLIATRTIEKGEEITVPFNSDADAERKIRLFHLCRDLWDIVEEAMTKTPKPRPVLYFSGGKDSMVMLHYILFRMRQRPDLILHREPWKTHKYAFAEKIIRDWQMTCFDYPPLEVSMWMGRGVVAFTNHYQIGNSPQGRPSVLALPKNIIECDEGICGRHQIIERPCAAFRYPWNIAIIGHKSDDSDQIAGDVPLASHFVENGDGPNLCFPLKNWKQSDVWDYIEQFAVPIQEDRYCLQTRSERPDKRNNSDYFEVCINCIDRRKSGDVYCPLVGKNIPSVAEKISYQEPLPAYIVK